MVNSFLHIIKYEPKSLQDLENIVAPIIRENLEMKNVELLGYLNNVIVKMGFILLAYDYFKQPNKPGVGDDVYSAYHFFNFILSTKSLS